MKFQFKVVCEQRWNPFMQRFEERCETQLRSVDAWIVGAIVFAVASFVASIIIFAALMCLRCKVCYHRS